MRTGRPPRERKVVKLKEQRVSLVLGSGGARGLAHVGVIRWLEEHNCRIVSISGSLSAARRKTSE